MKKLAILVLILLLALLMFLINCTPKQAPSTEPLPSPIIPTPTNLEQLDIYKGSCVFWLEKGKVQYNDGQSTLILNINKKEGNISLFKDIENKLRFVYEIDGIGKTELSYDVSSLSTEQAHHFTMTWSVESGEINLYINAQRVAFARILY